MPKRTRKRGLSLFAPGELGSSPNWFVRGTYRGIRIHRSTGSHTKPPAGYIRQIEREIDDQLDSGPAETSGTFADAVREYVKDCPVSELRFITPLLDHFREMPLSMIDSAALKRAANTLYPNAKPQTRNRQALTPAGSILHHAHELGMCEYIRVSHFKTTKPKTTYAAPAVAGKLIAALPEARELQAPRIKGLRHGPGRLCYPRAFALFCFLTGRRSADAIGLKWSEVDLPARRIVIHRTKNQNPHTVPIHEDLFFVLANMAHKKGSVFGYSHRRQFLDDWHKACESCNIEHRRSEGGLTPHGMRHSFATWLRQQGKGLSEIMQAGGWENEKAALRYLHMDASEVTAAVTNLPSIGEKLVRLDKAGGEND